MKIGVFPYNFGRVKDVFLNFDVAVSFNGKDRNIVEEKVREMRRAGIRVFYDKDYEVETLGQDLSKLFRETYSQKS